MSVDDFKKVTAFISERKLKPEKLVALRIARLKSQDSLCRKCVKQKQLLCSGIRDYFVDDLSQARGVVILERGPCPKLSGLSDDVAKTNRQTRSLLPASAFKSTLEVEVTAEGLVAEGNLLPAKALFVREFTDSHQIAVEVLGSLFNKGADVRYLYPTMLTAHRENWEAWGVRNLTEADALIIVRPERLPGAKWVVDELEALITEAALVVPCLYVIMLEDSNNPLCTLLKELCEEMK